MVEHMAVNHVMEVRFLQGAYFFICSYSLTCKLFFCGYKDIGSIIITRLFISLPKLTWQSSVLL